VGPSDFFLLPYFKILILAVTSNYESNKFYAGEPALTQRHCAWKIFIFLSFLEVLSFASQKHVKGTYDIIQRQIR